jgi:hypothetical protein
MCGVLDNITIIEHLDDGGFFVLPFVWRILPPMNLKLSIE